MDNLILCHKVLDSKFVYRKLPTDRPDVIKHWMSKQNYVNFEIVEVWMTEETLKKIWYAEG